MILNKLSKLSMVIEWLNFWVEPELREKFITEDQQIWTPALATQDGFLGKEIWLNPESSDRLFLVIRWQTKQQWNAVPRELLDQTEAKFSQAMGNDNYKLLDVDEYQVRKFP